MRPRTISEPTRSAAAYCSLVEGPSWAQVAILCQPLLECPVRRVSRIDGHCSLKQLTCQRHIARMCLELRQICEAAMLGFAIQLHCSGVGLPRLLKVFLPLLDC